MSEIAEDIGKIGLMTLISRLLGFVRTMVIAAFFGALPVADAFFVAFRIPNMFRLVMGEGGITAAVVPVVSDIRLKKGAETANQFINKVFTILILVVVAIVVVGVLLSPWIVRLLAPGFSSEPEKYYVCVKLLQALFPYLIFISLSALVMGFLNSLRIFTVPAANSIFFNIAIILSLYILSGPWENSIYILVVGILVGGLLQVGIQLPTLWGTGFRFRWDFDPQNEDVRHLGRLLLPALFSLGIYQINITVAGILASFENLAGAGAVSALFYANFLIQFPLGIFGVSIATAVLPRISERASANDMLGLKAHLQEALGLSSFIMVPAAVGLVQLGGEIIRLLFEHGAFDAAATASTYKALAFYAIGLIAYAGVKIVTPVFYALDKPKIPVRIGVMAMVVNVVASLILVFPLGHGGLALGTALAAFFNLSMLLSRLSGQIGSVDLLGEAGKMSRIAVSAVGMYGVLAVINRVVAVGGAHLGVQVAVLLGKIAAGMVSYFIIAKLLGLEEPDNFLGLLLRRAKK